MTAENGAEQPKSEGQAKPTKDIRPFTNSLQRRITFALLAALLLYGSYRIINEQINPITPELPFTK